MLKNGSMKKALSLLLAVVILSSLMLGATLSVNVNADTTPIYRDTSYSFAERAADMVKRMTLQQKAEQLQGGGSATGTIALPAGDDDAGTLGTGLRQMVWWGEALHGYSRSAVTDAITGVTNSQQSPQNATSYPQPYSLGQTWDPELMYRIGQEIGLEARERSPGFDVNLSFYSPTVNLSRDPRWGRNSESYGEDPVQSALVASQFVNGMQGFEMDGETLIDPNGYWLASATLKHYLANNSESNRLRGSSNLTEQENREYYSRVYREIIKRSDPASVMSSYNRIQIAHAAYLPSEYNLHEQPGGINFYTLDTMLRQTFGFNGYTTSDCDSIGTAIAGTGTTNTSATQTAGGNGHGWRTPAYRWYGATANTANAGTATMTQPMTAAWAVMGGANLQCNAGYNGSSAPLGATAGNRPVTDANVANAVITPMGRYTESAVDVAVVKLLEARLRHGEFDDKVNYAGAPDSLSTGRVSWFDKARESVLSYGLTLPTATSLTQASMSLKRGVDSIATMTDKRMDLAAEAAGKSLVLLKNENRSDEAAPLLPMTFPSTDNYTVGVYGSCRTTIDLGLYSSRRDGTNGIGRMVNPVNGIREELQGKFGDRITVTDRGANSTASAADDRYVVAVIGDANHSTSAREDNDRASNNLLAAADINLVRNLYALNKNLIVVMITSGPVGEAATVSGVTSATTFFDMSPALLSSSQMGDRVGTGIGEVLAGVRNPSARTAGTWYPRGTAIATNTGMSFASLNQIKSYRLSPGTDGGWQSPYGAAYAPAAPYTYNADGPNRGRTYMYYNGTDEQAPLFPYGYGLSYTTFAYSNPVVKVNGTVQSGTGTISVNPNDKVEYEFKVTNTGSVAGSDVAQFYVKTPQDIYEQSTTEAKGQAYALKRLKDFAKTKELAPGESETISLSVEIPDIAFWSNANGKFELKQATDNYTLQISRSSDDTLTKYGQNCGALLTRGLRINNAANWNPKVSTVSFKPNTPADVTNEIPERLIYKIADTINPNPTVALADDTLHGYINRLYTSSTGQAHAMPSNIKMTYTSNRPQVVFASSTGVLTAVGGGVATITGTAHDSLTGSSTSSEFVVYVDGEASTIGDLTLKSFTFGGETRTVAAGAYVYDVYVPSGTTNIASLFTASNVVATTPEDVDKITVELSADGAVVDGTPCVATVKVWSKAMPTVSEIYTINFGHMQLSWEEGMNYMGYQSHASVRFYDGVTKFMLLQAWYDAKSGALKYLGTAETEYNIPKHGSETLVAITFEEDIAKPGEDYETGGEWGLPIGLLEKFTLKAFLWDGNFVPLLPAQDTAW